MKNLTEKNDTHKSHIKSNGIVNKETNCAGWLRNNIDSVDKSV